jgi:hypothetical protein
MDDVVAELEAVMADLDSRAEGEATMIARPKSVPQPVRPPRARRRTRVWPLLVAALLLAAVIGAVVLAARGDGDGGGAVSDTPVRLAGVASYDPQGDDREEHPERVADATDGDASTYWTTSTYESFSDTKDGVGLVVDAGERRELSQLSVTTDTPGFTAEIRAGNSAEGPFDTVVGASKTVGATAVWDLEGADHRYYTIWITDLDGRARVNEVKAS